MKKNTGKKLLLIAGAVLTISLGGFGVSTVSYAYTQTTGTVASDNVKVRADASTSASQVSSLSSGDTVDIVDEVTDGSGYVWYKIFVNANEYGYVRSDLVTKSGSSSSTTTTSDSSTTTTAATLPETQVTAVDSQTATVTVASANVRSGAGTAYNSVGTVANGDTVTITGEATGTDSKKWYQISFGNDRTGFVRADLLTIGAASSETTETDTATESTSTDAVTEGDSAVTDAATEGDSAAATEGASTDAATTETTVEETSTENNDYEIKYNQDADGNYAYYLYDNVQGNYMKVTDLLNLAYNTSDINTLEKQNGKMKMAIIIMAVILAVLVLGLIALIFHFKDDFYYEDDEDDEDEEDRFEAKRKENDKRKYIDNKREARETRTERKTNDRNSDRSADRKSERVVRNQPKPETSSARRVKNEKSEAEKTIDRKADAYRKASEEMKARPEAPKSISPEPGVTPTPRKAKNFVSDDTMEFEFLDLDNDEDLR